MKFLRCPPNHYTKNEFQNAFFVLPQRKYFHFPQDTLYCANSAAATQKNLIKLGCYEAPSQTLSTIPNASPRSTLKLVRNLSRMRLEVRRGSMSHSFSFVFADSTDFFVARKIQSRRRGTENDERDGKRSNWVNCSRPRLPTRGTETRKGKRT